MGNDIVVTRRERGSLPSSCRSSDRGPTNRKSPNRKSWPEQCSTRNRKNSAQCSLFLLLQKYLLFAFGRPFWWRNIHRGVAPAWFLRDPGPPTSPAFLRLGHHLFVQGFYPGLRFQGSHALFVLCDLGRHPRHRRFDLLKTVQGQGRRAGKEGRSEG